MSEVERPRKINVLFMGHVDAGKSTTVGCVEYNLGTLTERELEKLKKEAESLNKGTFSFAYNTDTTKAERERGITISATAKEFKIKDRIFQIIDAPGHRDFMKNFSKGASFARAAVLVLDASTGSYEVSIDPENGQAANQLRMTVAFGIQHYLVFINKIDTQLTQAGGDKRKERFEYIVEDFSGILKRSGVKLENVRFVTGSSFMNQNIKEPFAEISSWYKGKPLMEEMYDFLSSDTNYDASPFRLSIGQIYQIKGFGSVYSGAITAGCLAVDDLLYDVNISERVQVKSIEMYNKKYTKAYSGDNVGLTFKQVNKANSPKTGDVLGPDAEALRPKTVSSFVGDVLVLHTPNGIGVNAEPIVCIQQANVASRITAIEIVKRKKVAGSKKGGASVDENKAYKGDRVRFTCYPRKLLVAEAKGEGPPHFSRFSMREGPAVIAIGAVVSVVPGVVDRDIFKKRVGGKKVAGG